MRTQIAKTGYLPAEYILPTFLTRTPSPFCAGWRWGLLSRKIFFIFLTSFWNFIFFQNPNLNSLSFARYSSSDFSLCIISYWFLLWILIFSFTIFDSDYNFGLCIFRFYISTRFYSLNFTHIKLCRFNSSTLYLFDSSAYYKQTSMLMRVCFMFVLAILRLSDVFSFVLGVVYRLGLK